LETVVRITLLFLCGLLGGCTQAAEDHPDGANTTVADAITHFPRRKVPESEWIAGGDALIAGRLIVSNGCLALQTDGQVRPIVWHRDAQLAADGRGVVDTRTGQSVPVGATISLAGGVYDRPPPETALRAYRDLPEKCVGDKFIVVGMGFHD
jgi:hypothetical protein